MKQEIGSGSGISWAICKSAPCSRQITTPVPHHSVFTGRMPFLPPNQQRQSTDGIRSKHIIMVSCLSVHPSVHLSVPGTARAAAAVYGSSQAVQRWATCIVGCIWHSDCVGNEVQHTWCSCDIVLCFFSRTSNAWTKKTGPQTHDHNSVKS